MCGYQHSSGFLGLARHRYANFKDAGAIFEVGIIGCCGDMQAPTTDPFLVHIKNLQVAEIRSQDREPPTKAGQSVALDLAGASDVQDMGLPEGRKTSKEAALTKSFDDR